MESYRIGVELSPNGVDDRKEPQCPGVDTEGDRKEPQCHGVDVEGLKEPQYYGADTEELKEPQCPGADTVEPQYHGVDTEEPAESGMPHPSGAMDQPEPRNTRRNPWTEERFPS